MNAFAVALTALLIGVSFKAHAGYNEDYKGCLASKENPVAAVAACTRLLGNKKLTRDSILNARASARFRSRDFDGAIADFDQAIKLKPGAGHYYSNRGAAWLRKGEHQKALADYTQAIRLEPASSLSRRNRSDVFLDMGEFDKAMEDANAAIRLEPTNSGAYIARAGIWQSKGDYDRAIADYDLAIKHDPKSEIAYANRGSTWKMKGDLDRAIADLDTQLRVATFRNDFTYTARGDVYRYKGEFERALRDFDEVLRLVPDNISAMTGRGLTYEKMGNAEAARSEYRKALASNPTQRNYGFTESLKTAQSRLEALESGASQPTIAPAPAKAIGLASIPTKDVSPAPAIVSKPPSGRRVALVIGNSAYRSVSPLSNPRNDAEAIARSLRNIGFATVTLALDATREKLMDALRAFAVEAENSDWSMVYYAGHGIEVGGVNYLVPVDARLAVDRDIEYEAVSVAQVLRAADGARKIKLVMLDACRDNPFTPRKTGAPDAIARASTAGGTIATRSSNGRGLAEVKVTGATLVIFAAKDGQVALDGEGGNSPFAIAVVQRLATPGVEINKVFRLVRDDVMEATAGRQEPYTYGSLPGKEDFFFVAR
ncbi:MAG: tetratricopeptide repeat protein [Pseudomonadota bacterium]